MSDIKVEAAPDILQQLTEAFEGLEVDQPEALAAELGVTPPDDREGWRFTYNWGPNGEDLGLHWYQPADEPDTQID